MSAASSVSRLRRLRNSPLRDLLRGRLSGRWDWQRRVDAADIPAEAKALVRRVVRKTRLWRAEKVDVADELIAHFEDAAAAEVSIEEAVENFGDPKQAAKLIRRAKIRNRPLVWHGVKWLRRGVLAMIVIYLALCVVYLAGRPSPSVDYVAVLNKPIQETPLDQHAWPIYRELLVWGGNWDDAPVTFHPGTDEWPAARAWVEAHPNLIEQMRLGAAKPVLGFVYGTGGSINDPGLESLFGRKNSNQVMQPIDKWAGQQPQLVATITLPHLNCLRMMANCLATDAELAREARDGDRLTRDLVALLGIAAQTTKQEFFVQGLVGIGIRSVMLHVLDRILATDPAVLSDANLRELSHRLAGPRVAADLFDTRSSRIEFRDLLQRAFTDDGAGDGRMTPEGTRFITDLVAGTTSPTGQREEETSDVAAQLLAPPAILLMAGRREMLEKYEQALDRVEADYHLPLRDVASVPPDAALIAIQKTPVMAMHYAPIAVVEPALSRAQVVAERYLARRDALQLAMALELHKRGNGSYPATLNELSPHYLPSIPVDPITGGPLHYKLVNGKPLIYSVGDDRDDDGGAPPIVNGQAANHRAAEWRATGVSGDWVLFPQR